MKSVALSVVAIFFLAKGSFAQSLLPLTDSLVQLVSPKGDTISALLFPIKSGYAAKTLERQSNIYIGWSAYRVNGKRVCFRRNIIPYTIASNDLEIIQLYREQNGNRKLYVVGGITGGALMLAGGITLMTRLDRVLFVEDSDYGWSGGLFIGGLLLSVVGIVGLEVSLKKARSAVELYSDKYLNDKSSFSLRLGTSSTTSSGIAIQFRF